MYMYISTHRTPIYIVLHIIIYISYVYYVRFMYVFVEVYIDLVIRFAQLREPGKGLCVLPTVSCVISVWT